MTNTPTAEGEADSVDPDTRSQIRERLTWTPAERLAYLVDMVAFEHRVRSARRLR